MSPLDPKPENARGRRIGVTALFVLGWIAAGLWLMRDHFRPRLVLLDPRIDVGSVAAGSKTEVNFRLENRGLAPLELIQVVGSCGCVTPQFPASIPPFGKADIRTRFEPLPDWSGPMDKVLTIRTNDSAQREVQAHLIAQVEGLFRREPEQLPPVAYRFGETHRRTVRLTPRAGSGVKVTAANTEVPFLKPTLIPPRAGDPDGTYELQIAIGPCMLTGDFNIPVRLSTTDPRVPVMNVMVVGQAQSGPVINPIRIFEPAFRPGNAGDEMLQARLFTRSGQLKVKSAKTTIPGIDVRVLTDQPGRVYTLTLAQNRVLESGPHEGQLIVATDDGKTPTISVPVHITVQ